MQCNTCGRELDNNARFCTTCGYRVTKEQQQATQQTTVTNVITINTGQNSTPSSRQIYINKSFDELKAAAKSQIRGNIAVLFIMILFWQVLTTTMQVPSVIEALATLEFISAPSEIWMTLGLFASIFSFIFPAVMEWGLIANSARVYSNEKATIATGFSGFKNMGAAIGTYIMMSLYLFLWALLFVIPAIVKAYSYACSMFIRFENPNWTANDCITKSREIMDGHKMRLFCYDMYFALLFFLSIFTLFIALIWLLPYYYQFRYNFYQSIKKNNTCNNEVNPI